MHPNDKIQKFTKGGEPIMDGGITFDELMSIKEKDFFVGGSLVFIFRHGANGLEILFQQRTERMKTYPNKWDIHGGYINYGETFFGTALREVKEEVNITLSPEKLQYGFTVCNSDDEICTYYFYDFTGETQEIAFSDQEVKSVQWINFSDYKQNKNIVDFKENFLGYNQYFDLSIEYLKKYGNLDN